MELQFHKNGIGYLKNILWQSQCQEQTQELKLAEGLPDVGRVLGTWGQVIVRSKQWQSDSLGLSGGVMVWVMYAPQDAGPLRSVQTWIPFQMNWDIADTKADGIMAATCVLRAADTRMIASRKLMVRVNVGALMQAYLPDYADVYGAEDLPKDVQVQKKTYSVCLPKDAGEKPFTLDEELQLPASCPKAERFLRYRVQPQVLESRVMAGKIVFRGSCVINTLYTAQDGQLQSWDFDVPFSQFAELDGQFDEDARAWVLPQLTGLEVQADEQGRIRLKASVTGQYVVFENVQLDVIADAYSPCRDVVAKCQELELPGIEGIESLTLPLEHCFHLQAQQAVDGVILPDQARVQSVPDGTQVQLPALGQLLYCDEQGALQTAVTRWEDQTDVQLEDDRQLLVALVPDGRTRYAVSDDEGQLGTQVQLNCARQDLRRIVMVTALELGQLRQPDPARPSVILRRMDRESLWQLAKSCGSSEAQILAANALTEEPPVGKMLIIPVL